MQNPFTTTFSKTPEYTYITTNRPKEIIDNLSFESPSESVYKITGVRGSGKTVILAKIEEELRQDRAVSDAWVVIDINPTRDMLMQIAAKLSQEGYSKKNTKDKSFNISATVAGTGGGLGFSSEKDKDIFDIGVEIENMLEKIKKKGKKLFIGIDEVSKTQEMIVFASEFGKWLRAGYPVYLVCTGLYENIRELSSVKNLTFFQRATTIQTEPLNIIRMTEMYKNKLGVDHSEATRLAKSTKGYAYAFQELGVLYFNKKKNEMLDDIIDACKTELFVYSYDKIWEEMTENDRFFVSLFTDNKEYKRDELVKLMGERCNNYSMYRDRLLKRGIILDCHRGYVSLALPFFEDYVRDYGLSNNE